MTATTSGSCGSICWRSDPDGTRLPAMPGVIDSDQHLYEPRGMWAEHIDPGARDEALELADVHLPGNVKSNGDHRRNLRGGHRSSYVYDEVLPETYWSPAARVQWLDE